MIVCSSLLPEMMVPELGRTLRVSQTCSVTDGAGAVVSRADRCSGALGSLTFGICGILCSPVQTGGGLALVNRWIRVKQTINGTKKALQALYLAPWAAHSCNLHRWRRLQTRNRDVRLEHLCLQCRLLRPAFFRPRRTHYHYIPAHTCLLLNPLLTQITMYSPSTRFIAFRHLNA